MQTNNELLLERSFFLQQEIVKRAKKKELAIRKELAGRKIIDFTSWTMPEYSKTWAHKEYAKILDMFARGEIERLIISMQPQAGKALEETTPILTTNGWKDHKDLVPGDYVYGESGNPVKVIQNHGVSDVKGVRVEFQNGSFLDSSENHEWHVWCDRGEGERRLECLESRHLLKGQTRSPLIKSPASPGFYVKKTTIIGKIRANCITVEGGLYLAGKALILTHNSELSTRRLPAYLLGKDPNLKIAIASYNATFAKKFCRQVQQIISSKEYNQIFPNTTISNSPYSRYSSNKYIRTQNEFEIINHKGSVKAVGRSGSLTGERVDTLILDDIYKNYEEGNSPIIREAAIDFYITVANSRLHNNSQQLIVFTRWHEEDLVGFIENTQNVITLNKRSQLENIDKDKKTWYKINFPALATSESLENEFDLRSELGQAFWPEKHNEEKLLASRSMDVEKFESLYQGDPRPSVGLLFSDDFKTYMTRPQFQRVMNYTDTADMGNDWLCSICFGVGLDEKIYVLDILYSDKKHEETEPLMVEMLKRNNIKECIIESNNGGRGFARNIDRMLNYTIDIKTFHQTENKESRVLTNASSAQRLVFFPQNWKGKFPKFSQDLLRFKRNFKSNKHDDACFIAGTKIKTIFGDKNIEEIKIGDKIITPFGVRKVLNSKMTGTRAVVTNVGLTGTPDHKIFNGKFEPLENIKKLENSSKFKLRELILWRLKKLSYLMEQNTSSWGREDITLANQRKTNCGNALKVFMLLFGNFIIKRQFPRAIIYIIKMVIALTMILAIWSWLRLGNICLIMLKNCGKIKTTVKKGLSTLIKLEKKPRSGIGAPRVKGGIVRMVKSLRLKRKRLLKSVIIAVKNIRPSNRGQNIVRKCCQPRLEKVYNITVEKDGVYYANNVLVSNCDSLIGICEWSGVMEDNSSALWDM